MSTDTTTTDPPTTVTTTPKPTTTRRPTPRPGGKSAAACHQLFLQNPEQSSRTVGGADAVADADADTDSGEICSCGNSFYRLT